MSDKQRERPADDKRFTVGHGYPEPGGRELVELQQALCKSLYVDTDLGTRPLEQR